VKPPTTLKRNVKLLLVVYGVVMLLIPILERPRLLPAKKKS
jgi:hypothetical protein